MNVTLPSIHTIFPGSILSPSLSPTSDDDDFMTIARNKVMRDFFASSLHMLTGFMKTSAEYSPPRLPFPLTMPKGASVNNVRRVSTCSTSSAPSLSYSPSPSPSPPPTQAPPSDAFLLVPCAMHMADAVVIVADSKSVAPPARRRSLCTPPPTPIYRPCKASESRATLLIGPAISAYGRKSAARMHPYRIIRDRRI
ncbi:hypothetical protein BU17DRAFT_66456 [Hysterangium stoloniferum]|nr:hypothetical protein BU17DRAFT_66456 [Hysterangium stoloniferum]